jgi:hypothetical protein
MRYDAMRGDAIQFDAVTLVVRLVEAVRCKILVWLAWAALDRIRFKHRPPNQRGQSTQPGWSCCAHVSPN